ILRATLSPEICPLPLDSSRIQVPRNSANSRGGFWAAANEDMPITSSIKKTENLILTLFRHHSVFRQEILNEAVDPHTLFGAESAVAAAGDGDELIRHIHLCERFVQTHRFGIGHGAIGIAVNRNDRRQSRPHVGQW